MKEYNCSINYHPGKANVVVDALSRKLSACLAHMITTQGHILEDLKRIGIEVILYGQTEVLSHLRVQLTLIDRIKTAQSGDPHFRKTSEVVKAGCSEFRLDENSVL